MASREFEELKEALKQPPTPEAMKEAAERFRQYEQARKTKRSRPNLASLSFRKTYPNAIPLDKIPDELERNPEFFELMGRVVEEG